MSERDWGIKKIEIQQIIEISQKQWISTGGLLIR